MEFHSQRNPLDCLRCNNLIRNPVRLPCHHYFCISCLNVDKCPVCSRTISSGDLVVDKVLNYVVESSREATETCGNCDQISQPMYFCDTCQQPLCNGCREITHKAKIFTTHHIIKMDERGRVRGSPSCPVHNEKFIIFCNDSKSLMCIKCLNSSSLEPKHILNTEVAYVNCCDKLEKCATKLKVFQNELREEIELRKRLLVELETNGNQLIAGINHKCDEIIQRVNILRENLLDGIMNEMNEKKHQISLQLDRFFSLEAPISVNLLSISIFCSYASKMDVLHCFADLIKAVQQFLSTNGSVVQKIKFDCSLAVNFAEEFNQFVCQPLGLSTNSFLNCDSGLNNCQRNEFNEESTVNGLIIRECLPQKIDELVDGLGGADLEKCSGTVNDIFSQCKFSPPSQLYNDMFPINSFNLQESESHGHGLFDQRFMEHFKIIMSPLRQFAEEISLISRTLLDFQKDITLRRCVVNGENIISKINRCEEAWNRLEVHNRKVQRIVNHNLRQIWRRELERVHLQQLAVREKVREMLQLQHLAKRALKVSQIMKPFAVQMASLISVIDNRRSGSITPSPMEQICSEITKIEPNSQSRVAAIEKEEELRRILRLKEEKKQSEQREAIQTKKSLKEVRAVAPKQHKGQLVLEIDRDRQDIKKNNGTNSCLSSPSMSKRRNQIQHRTHRNSESSKLDASFDEQFNSSLGHASIKCSNELDIKEVAYEPENTIGTPSSSANDESKVESSTEGGQIEQLESVIPPSKDEPEKPSKNDSPPQRAPPSVPTIAANVLRLQTQDRDPSLILVKEKLLEAIRERVKRID